MKRFAAALLCALLWSESAHANHCYGDDEANLVFTDSLIIVANGMGIENHARFGACWPLITEPGLLFEYTHVELGVFHNLSPIYLQQGGYASLSPLSFLVLRAEASSVHVWAIPGGGGFGHFARSGYDDSFASDWVTFDVTEKEGDAGGFNLRADATLQGALPFASTSSGDVELVIFNLFGVEHWRLGDDPFYYNQRMDTIMARSDAAMTNDAAVVVSVPFGEGNSVRFGAIDSLVYVPGAALLSTHQVGGLLALSFQRVGESIRGVEPFFAATGYTQHATRRLASPLNFILGLDLSVIAR